MKKTNIQVIARKILAHQYFDCRVHIFNRAGSIFNAGTFLVHVSEKLVRGAGG